VLPARGPGEPGVEAVPDRFFDEALQDRIVEDVPPGDIGE